MRRVRLRRIQIAALSLIIGIGFSGCRRNLPTIASPSSSVTAEASSSVEKSAMLLKTSVYAGSLTPGTADGARREAEFIKPHGICVDGDGALLVVDSYGNMLRTIQGEAVGTLAGDASYLGRSGYPLGGYRDGDAAQSWLNRPRFATVSSEGVVVFSDSGNHVVRVLSQGKVYLLAGSRQAGYQNGSFNTAQFNIPSGVAIDQEGAVYVADTLNHCIRVISPDGMVSTLAGSPYRPGFEDGSLETARFCEPNDLEFGPDGALYVVDKGNQRIRKIQNGTVTTVTGSGREKDLQTGYIVGGYQDGTADKAQFLYPTGLCFSQTGVLYIADTGNNCIRAVSPSGETVTLAGARMAGSVDAEPLQARFNQPVDLVFQDGALYVSDSYNHVIRMVPVDEDCLF